MPYWRRSVKAVTARPGQVRSHPRRPFPGREKVPSLGPLGPRGLLLARCHPSHGFKFLWAGHGQTLRWASSLLANQARGRPGLPVPMLLLLLSQTHQHHHHTHTQTHFLSREPRPWQSRGSRRFDVRVWGPHAFLSTHSQGREAGLSGEGRGLPALVDERGPLLSPCF